MNFSREYSRCEESLDRLSKEKKQTECQILDNDDEFKKHLIASGISVLAIIASVVGAIALNLAFLAVTAIMGYMAYSEISGAVICRGEQKELAEKLSNVKQDIQATEKYRDNLIAGYTEECNENKIKASKEKTNANTELIQEAQDSELER